MTFIENLSEEEYYSYYKKCSYNHFMQSYEWGTINKNNRNQIPCYVGLKDNDKLVAVALLLKKVTPFGMCYFYCPRGYTMEFNDLEVLKVFTDELMKYLKRVNGIYIKLDPPIRYQTIDMDANPVDGENNYDLFNYFIKLGYKHKGFNKLYEGNQPRYTFRTYFKDHESFDTVEKLISKSYMRNIKRSYNYDIKISMGDNVNDFYELIKIISEKDGFHEYTLDYYTDVYNELSKRGFIKVFNALINPGDLIHKFSDMVSTEKNADRVNKLNKDIEYLKSLDKSEEHIIGSLVCVYSNKGAWSLYIGNDRTAELTGCINRLYYEFIKDAYESGYEFADLFGTVGDPKTKYKNLAGIFEHKRMLGGEYVEFIGEFDLVNKKFWYKVLPIILNIYRKIKKSR